MKFVMEAVSGSTKLFFFPQALLQTIILHKVIYRMPQIDQDASAYMVTSDIVQGSEHCVLKIWILGLHQRPGYYLKTVLSLHPCLCRHINSPSQVPTRAVSRPLPPQFPPSPAFPWSFDLLRDPVDIPDRDLLSAVNVTKLIHLRGARLYRLKDL